jgi:hypothetical protein
MRSRLESLLSDLTVCQVEDRRSFCIGFDVLEDLLAVVEAARHLREPIHRKHKDIVRNGVLVMRGAKLDEALAKLDEVQP